MEIMFNLIFSLENFPKAINDEEKIRLCDIMFKLIFDYVPFLGLVHNSTVKIERFLLMKLIEVLNIIRKHENRITLLNKLNPLGIIGKYDCVYCIILAD